MTMTEQRCRHRWQPMADKERIWQVCIDCRAEEHVTTHADALFEHLAYIFKDFSAESQQRARRTNGPEETRSS